MRHANDRVHLLAGAAALLAMLVSGPAAVAQSTPALPAPPQTFEVPYVAPTGRIINVNAGDDLQQALNQAQRGDTLVLAAGATFTGSFTLPYKATGTGWIYIQSSAYLNLPPPGTRVTLAQAVHMPKIVAPGFNEPAVRADSRASHYRFVGIEIRPRAGDFVTNLVQIGNGERSVDQLPSHIVFDRVIVRGDPAVGGRRGIAMDGRFVAVIDSHIADFKEPGADSQGLWAFNTPGPLKVVNNHVEGAGENLMLGGADPAVADLVPSDVEIRGNLFFKPLYWINERWSVKNSLELKNARRVLIADNTFQNNWVQAQVGFAILFTPRNQDGTAPWTQVADVSFVRNRILNSAQGISILGADYLHPSRRTERILIQDNFVQLTGLGANGTPSGSSSATARMLQVGTKAADIVVDHNTLLIDSGVSRVVMYVAGDELVERFAFTNNVADRGDFGFFGDNSAEGNVALNQYFKTWIFARNAIIGAAAGRYPADNFFPPDRAAVRFSDPKAGDFTLAASSQYKGAATDGTDLGARGVVARLPSNLVTAPRPRPPGSLTVQ